MEGFYPNEFSSNRTVNETQNKSVYPFVNFDQSSIANIMNMDDVGWMTWAHIMDIIKRPDKESTVTEEQGDRLRKGFSCQPMLKNRVLENFISY